MSTVYVITTLVEQAPTVAPVGISTEQLVSILLGTILPILVGLVTKVTTNSSVKALLLAALSAISGVGSEFLGNQQNFVWQQAVLTGIITFITAVSVHYGLWKPVGVTQKAQRAGVK
jgi:hypothetical protein